MIGFFLFAECQFQKLLNFLHGLVLVLSEGGFIQSTVFVDDLIILMIGVGVVIHPIEVHLAVDYLRREAARCHIEEVAEV